MSHLTKGSSARTADTTSAPPGKHQRSIVAAYRIRQAYGPSVNTRVGRRESLVPHSGARRFPQSGDAGRRESPQLTTQPLDVLDDLDWTAIVCQNHRRKCDHEATLIVEWHAIDHCNETGHPDGNLVELLCQQCLEWLQHEV